MRARLVLFGSIVTAIIMIGAPVQVHATKYGAGSYGRCQYDSCAISMSSSTAIAANVLPNGGTTCSVAKDTVTVTTSSSTGYSLSLIDSDTTTSLTATGGATMAASSGTLASPAPLTAGRWGYRVDNAGGFGAGPTSAVSNGAVPTLAFAGVQPSSGTAAQIVNSASAATNGVATSVWYGVCAGAAQPSGSYSDGVLYTALVN